jgi:hypothetical protein
MAHFDISTGYAMMSEIGFVGIGDPVGQGFVASLARPGGIFDMDQRDQELLAKQLRAITPAPPRDGAIVVIIVMAFLTGMTLGGLFTGSISEPTRVAAKVVPPYPGGTLLTMR